MAKKKREKEIGYHTNTRVLLLPNETFGKMYYNTLRLLNRLVQRLADIYKIKFHNFMVLNRDVNGVVVGVSKSFVGPRFVWGHSLKKIRDESGGADKVNPRFDFEGGGGGW